MTTEDVEKFLSQAAKRPGRTLLILLLIALSVVASAFLTGIGGKTGERLVERKGSEPIAGTTPDATAAAAVPSSKAPVGSCDGITIIDSQKRKGITAQMYTALAGAGLGRIDVPVQVDEWIGQAETIGSAHPCVVVIHLHSLQPLYADDADKGYARAEQMLLRGLNVLVGQSPGTSIVIYSSSFARQRDGTGLEQRLSSAVSAEAGRDRKARAGLTAIARRAVSLYWPNMIQARLPSVLRDELEKVVRDARTTITSNQDFGSGHNDDAPAPAVGTANNSIVAGTINGPVSQVNH